MHYRMNGRLDDMRMNLGSNFLANTGGLMGLCLGFSGLSAVEVIYFCTIRLWFKRKRLRHRGKRIAMKFVRALKSIGGRLSSRSTSAGVVGKEITLQKHTIPILTTAQSLSQHDMISNLMWYRTGKPVTETQQLSRNSKLC
jgi:hypothetical protein